MSGKFELNDFINEPDILQINGKDFKLRDLTMAEIVRFQRVFNLATKEITKAFKPLSLWEKLLGIKRRDVLGEGKSSEDFKVLKTAFDICNEGQPFTEKDFDSLTPKQIMAISTKILERNYFFDKTNLVRQVFSGKQ